jgi:hypothetical protein
MPLKTFLARFYFFSFLQWFAPIWAVEKLFIQSRGVSLQGISLLVILWMVALMLLEIPTGVLADRYSRRNVILLSTFLSVFYFIGDLVSHNLWGFTLAWLLYAPAVSLSTGSMESYLHDVLDTHGRGEEFSKTWGRARAFSTGGSGIALAIGGWLATSSFENALYASIGAMCIGTLAVLSLPNLAPTPHPTGESYWQSALEGFRAVRSNSGLILAATYSLFIVSSVITIEEFKDIYLQSLGLHYVAIGLTDGAIYVIAALGGLFAHRLVPRRHIPVLVAGGLGISLVLSLLHASWVALLIIPLMLVISIGSILSDTIIQEEAEEHRRATVASVCSLATQLSILQVFAYGYLAQRFSPQPAMLVISVSLAGFLGVWLWRQAVLAQA